MITENAHPAIVDDDLWEAVQARLGRIRVHVNGKGGNNTAHSPYLLHTGLLKCSECGANFVMSTRKINGATYRYGDVP